MKWFKRRQTRRRAMGGTAVGVVVATALVAQMSMVSNASWNDEEWVNAGPVGTTECGPDGEGFLTRSEGRALSGQILGQDLDSLVAAQGVQVTNDGTTAVASAGQPVPGLEFAFRDPLTVDALSAIQLPLTGLLELPTNNNTGVLGQFGQATNSGAALGASGYVTDSGGIDLADEGTGSYPDLATLSLSALLNSPLLGEVGLGDTLAGVSDVDLRLGAVAGQASLDACAQAWAGPESSQLDSQAMADAVAADVVEGLERQYLAASAELSFNSPAVGNIVTAIGGSPAETCTSSTKSVLKTVECAVNGLTSNAGVIQAIRTGVIGLLGTLTSGLGLGQIDVNLTATTNFSAVQALLDDTLTDSGGFLTVNLGDGRISVDTAALVQAAYPGQYGDGLNGLPPNTNLLNDDAVLSKLTEQLALVLGEWISQVTVALVQVVKDTTVYAHLKINLTLSVLAGSAGIGYIDAVVGCPATSPTPSPCTLETLLDPTQNKNATKATFIVLPGLKNIPILGGILDGLVNGVVGGLISGLVGLLISGLGGVVGVAVDAGLTLVKTLPAIVSALVTPVIAAVTNLYSGLFLENILSITLNAQNSPASGGPVPPDWRVSQPTAPPDGQFEVAAIRVGVLDGLGPFGVRLYLGRASVGPGCSVLSAAQPESPCTGY